MLRFDIFSEKTSFVLFLFRPIAYLPTMKEFISVYLGQAGVQLGAHVEEQHRREACVELDGICSSASRSSLAAKSPSLDVFYSEEDGGRFRPRSIFADTETDIVDSIQTGPMRRMFHPDTIISRRRRADAPRGVFTGPTSNEQSDSLVQGILRELRHQADTCDKTPSFNVYHGADGGTGSGVTAAVLSEVRSRYPKAELFTFSMYGGDSSFSCNPMAPYNEMLFTHAALENAHWTSVFSNDALHRLCKTHLAVDRPSFNEMNEVASQVCASVHCRQAEDAVSSSSRELISTMIPYPRIHLISHSWSPIHSEGHRKCFPPDSWYPSTMDITLAALDPSAMVTSCNPRHGIQLGMTLLYRGQVGLKEAQTIVSSLKHPAMEAVDWWANVVRPHVHDIPMRMPRAGSCLGYYEKSVTTVMNTSAVADVFLASATKFDKLFSRAIAHLHVPRRRSWRR